MLRNLITGIAGCLRKLIAQRKSYKNRSAFLSARAHEHIEEAMARKKVVPLMSHPSAIETLCYRNHFPVALLRGSA
jgi:hypothetical protein